jgi:hypothetical protein
MEHKDPHMLTTFPATSIWNKHKLLSNVFQEMSANSKFFIQNASIKDGINYGGATETDIFNLKSLNSKLSDLEEKILIVIFLSVIIMGLFGNILVISTVLINKHMKTSSNLFILNLAISDLTLCVFSIPFMTYKTLKHTWIFGEFLCRLAPFFQASNVFVSTMSITAIALDRLAH